MVLIGGEDLVAEVAAGGAEDLAAGVADQDGGVGKQDGRADVADEILAAEGVPLGQGGVGIMEMNPALRSRVVWISLSW